MVIGDSKKAFLELGFVGMVATHVYDHEWVGRSFIKHKKISKLWKFLKKHLFFFSISQCTLVVYMKSFGMFGISDAYIIGVVSRTTH